MYLLSSSEIPDKSKLLPVGLKKMGFILNFSGFYWNKLLKGHLMCQRYGLKKMGGDIIFTL